MKLKDHRERIVPEAVVFCQAGRLLANSNFQGGAGFNLGRQLDELNHMGQCSVPYETMYDFSNTYVDDRAQIWSLYITESSLKLVP